MNVFRSPFERNNKPESGSAEPKNPTSKDTALDTVISEEVFTTPVFAETIVESHIISPLFGDWPSLEGNIFIDGFKAMNVNSSHDQDAFAVNLESKTFVVCDGVSSGGLSGVVSRCVSRAIASCKSLNEVDEQYIIDAINEGKEALMKLRAKMTGQYHENNFEPFDGLTTICAAQYINKNTVDIFALGDSPIYVTDKDGNILRSFNEETACDNITEGYIGVRIDNLVKGVESLVKWEPTVERITLKDGERIVLASDYISDGLPVKPRLIRNIRQVSGKLRGQSRGNTKVLATLERLVKELGIYEAARDGKIDGIKDLSRYEKQMYQNYVQRKDRTLNEFFCVDSEAELASLCKSSPWKRDDCTVVVVDGDFLGF